MRSPQSVIAESGDWDICTHDYMNSNVRVGHRSQDPESSLTECRVQIPGCVRKVRVTLSATIIKRLYSTQTGPEQGVLPGCINYSHCCIETGSLIMLGLCYACV